MRLLGVASMLNNPTVEKLKDLKLKVMAQMLSTPDDSLKELSSRNGSESWWKRNGWPGRTLASKDC